jgi:hypothetical protein
MLRAFSEIVDDSRGKRGPVLVGRQQPADYPYHEEPTMKLSYIATALLFAASAISSAPAHSQTISVSPHTLVVNIGAGENFLATVARNAAGSATDSTVNVPSAPSSPTQTSQAPTTVLPSPPVAPVTSIPALPPVEVPSVIGGQKINADAQRITKCLIENRGNKYLCGMQELNGEIAKCVGGVGTPGGCFTAPLTRLHPSPAPRQQHPRYTRYYKNYYFF